MKEYEMIHEILNQCPLNHSRDQFLEEIECEDPEKYLHDTYSKEANVIIEKNIKKDGSLSFDVYASGIHHTYIFSEL